MSVSGRTNAPKRQKSVRGVGGGGVACAKSYPFYTQNTDINIVHKHIYSIFVVGDFMGGAIRKKNF